MNQNSHKKIKVLFVSLSLAMAGFVAGCALDSPTAFSGKRAEVVQELYSTEIETGKLDEAILEGIARHYDSNGAGTVEVVVSYNPSSRNNSAMTATENASRIGRIFGKNGVHDIKTEILPIRNLEKSVSYFSFKSYRAQAPADCNVITDIDDSSHRNYDDYKLGCSTETYLAKQVAKPRDLLGRAGMDDPDGRRLGNVVEWGYRTGDPKAPLEGEQASGD